MTPQFSDPLLFINIFLLITPDFKYNNVIDSAAFKKNICFSLLHFIEVTGKKKKNVFFTSKEEDRSEEQLLFC